MRAIAILAALAMVVSLFLPWLNPKIPGISLAPWDMVKDMKPSLDTVKAMAKDAPEMLAFLSTFALAAAFFLLALFGLPLRALAFLAGGGAVVMTGYAVLQLKDKAASLGLPVPKAENLAEIAKKLPDLLGMGALAWIGGALVLLLTAMVGYPAPRR